MSSKRTARDKAIGDLDENFSRGVCDKQYIGGEEVKAEVWASYKKNLPPNSFKGEDGSWSKTWAYG